MVATVVRDGQVYRIVPAKLLRRRCRACGEWRIVSRQDRRDSCGSAEAFPERVEIGLDEETTIDDPGLTVEVLARNFLVDDKGTPLKNEPAKKRRR